MPLDFHILSVQRTKTNACLTYPDLQTISLQKNQANWSSNTGLNLVVANHAIGQSGDPAACPIHDVHVRAPMVTQGVPCVEPGGLRGVFTLGSLQFERTNHRPLTPVLGCPNFCMSHPLVHPVPGSSSQVLAGALVPSTNGYISSIEMAGPAGKKEAMERFVNCAKYLRASPSDHPELNVHFENLALRSLKTQYDTLKSWLKREMTAIADDAKAAKAAAEKAIARANELHNVRAAQKLIKP
ncbi:hypothetical protein DFH28DRAFT_931811 [Melampsora americana]|nr:hypothetical protein DFH28DRAFT_931811 [Melampsora americana]